MFSDIFTNSTIPLFVVGCSFVVAVYVSMQSPKSFSVFASVNNICRVL